MFRPTATTKSSNVGERLRPIPQRNNNHNSRFVAVVGGGGSPTFWSSSPPQQPNGNNLRLVNILVPTATTTATNTAATDRVVSPLSSIMAFHSSNNSHWDATSAAAAPPFSPTACSPLTVSSDTWRQHSPSPTKQQQPQQQLPLVVGGGGFVPIGSPQSPSSSSGGIDWIGAAAPSPLSWALQQQQPGNNSNSGNSKEPAYRPYASPLPPRGGGGKPKQQLRALPSPHTADTCSVTTVGTTATATAVAAAARLPPAPPLYRRPASSLAVAAAAGCLPGHSHSKTTATAHPSGNNSYSNRGRPQSAPTLPTVTTVSHNNNNGNNNGTGGDDATTHQRKIRLKTELCMHYESGRLCPFGDHCTYAHGEEELQMTKLQDLHDAGLIDKATYRTKPCLTWTMTGSCPFGRRCACLHDHRVAAPPSIASWLPHTETQGNTIATDINVDGLFQKRLYSILRDNPLGDHLDLAAAAANPDAAFDNLYALLCGEELPADSSKKSGGGGGGGWNSYRNPKKGGGGLGRRGGGRSKGSRPKPVHPIYKLQIALKLRGDADWQYKYRPQHVVHDELCMVLNQRAFRVTGNDPHNSNGSNGRARLTVATATPTSSVHEISLNAYNPRHDGHILVHEIAFGPDSDPSVRGVALWFGIDDGDVTVCTPQQAKRFRWKKSLPLGAAASAKPAPPSTSEGGGGGGGGKIRASAFDSGALESFPMIRPHDEAAFRLTTDMLKHRLAVLKRERLSSMKDRHEKLLTLQHHKGALRDRFRNQVRDWTAWAWPVSAGRERAVDYNTPVPPVEGPYTIELPSSSSREPEDPARVDEAVVPQKGVHVHRIWNSFVEQAPLLSDDGGKSPAWPRTVPPPAAVPPRRRLAVFRDLANGQEIDECRVLPHILKHRAASSKGAAKKNKPNPSHHQERCWKALLLPPPKTSGGGSGREQQQTNEWSIVLQHFSNSRSHKVLTILQQ